MSEWGSLPKGIKEISGNTQGVSGFKPDVFKAARELAVPGVVHDEKGLSNNSVPYKNSKDGLGI
jgi:hypothetical protein